MVDTSGSDADQRVSPATGEPEALHSTVLEASPDGWDDALRQAKSGSLLMYQSTGWAERLRELFGIRPKYVCVYRGTRLVLGLQVFTGLIRYATVNLPPRVRIRTALKQLLYRLARRSDLCWYGEPVEFVDDIGGSEYTQLITTVDDFRVANRLRLSQGNWPQKWRGVLPPKFSLYEWATLVIDLRRSEEEILKSLKASARKEISKAAQRGVEIRQVETISELHNYYRFAADCAHRYGKDMFGFEDFETMWRHLRRWGYFETFVAYLAGEMIAGLSVWGDRTMVGELGSFQSQRAYDDKLGGSDAVKWAAIRWARQTGVNFFDLAGINPSPMDEKEITIRRFKEKWSGTERRFVILRSGWR
jgi:hypothetical protein